MSKKKTDPELKSLKRIAREFETFDLKQVERVLWWLQDRYITHHEARAAERAARQQPQVTIQ